VRNVKNTIIKSSDQSVNFFLYPNNNITPNITSKITTKTAIDNAKGCKNGRFNTGSEKYSSNLKEKPTGSLSLISPEIMNKIPVKILEKEVSNFNIANGF